MVGLTFVQTDLSPSLQIGVKQPVNYEQSALDATDLSQSKSQLVLTWI